MTTELRGQRTLILSNSFSGGGAEAVARLMVETFDQSTCVLFENNAQVKLKDRAVWVAGWKHSSGRVVTLLINLWRLMVVQVAKLIVRPSATISHLEGPNFANLLTGFGGRKIVFVHNRLGHSYQATALRERALLALGRFLYKRADVVVAVSSGIRDEMVNDFHVDPSKVLVLPNPIDLRQIRKKALEEYGDDRDHLLREKYLVSLASLTQQKNHRGMLKLYARIVSRTSIGRELKLVIAGTGPLKQELKEACERLELSFFDASDERDFDRNAQIFFMGYQFNPYPLLTNAQMLIMTSKWEGLPIALLESMGLGVPAAVTDCSESIREVWNITPTRENAFIKEAFLAERGILLPLQFDEPEYLDQATDMIFRIATNSEARDRLGQNCLVAAERFSIDRVKEMWEEKLLLY
jgi:glycosyltransferase involved in cell wall biosynthesis